MEHATQTASKPVTKNEIDAVRRQVQQVLSAAQAKSEISGKPLLILVGENHLAPQSALLETVIYQEARAFGVRDIALELPSKGVLGDLGREMLELPFARAIINGHSLIARQAQYFDAQTHKVDGRAWMLLDSTGKVNTSKDPTSVLKMAERNETMAANLANIDRSVLMLTGSLHLQGLVRRMENHATHTVVSFDTAQEIVRAGFGIRFPASTHMLSLEGDAGALSIDALIRLGMGQQEGSQFIGWLATEDLQKADRTLTENPNNIPALGQRVKALHELGEDREAGKTLGKTVFLCRSTNSVKERAQCDAALAGYSPDTVSGVFTDAVRVELERLKPKEAFEVREAHSVEAPSNGLRIISPQPTVQRGQPEPAQQGQPEFAPQGELKIVPQGQPKSGRPQYIRS